MLSAGIWYLGCISWVSLTTCWDWPKNISFSQLYHNDPLFQLQFWLHFLSQWPMFGTQEILFHAAYLQYVLKTTAADCLPSGLVEHLWKPKNISFMQVDHNYPSNVLVHLVSLIRVFFISKNTSFPQRACKMCWRPLLPTAFPSGFTEHFLKPKSITFMQVHHNVLVAHLTNWFPDHHCILDFFSVASLTTIWNSSPWNYHSRLTTCLANWLPDHHAILDIFLLSSIVSITSNPF